MSLRIVEANLTESIEIIDNFRTDASTSFDTGRLSKLLRNALSELLAHDSIKNDELQCSIDETEVEVRKSSRKRRKRESTLDSKRCKRDIDVCQETNLLYVISENLEKLLRWISSLPTCYQKGEKGLPSDFDILRGQTFSYYGLHSSTTWRQELAMLLLKFPGFKHDNFMFFAQIFKQSPQIWRQKLSAYKKLLNHEPMGKYNWKYCSKEKEFCEKVVYPITQERFKFRLKSSVEHSEGRVDLPISPSAVDVKCQMTSENDTAEGKGSESDGMLVSKSSEVIIPKTFSATILKPFGTMQYYGYKRYILPEMKIRHGIALLAICVNGNSCKAKTVVHHYESSLSDPAEEITNLVNVLTKTLGMSKKAVFKWKEMVPIGEGYSYRKYQPKKWRNSILKLSSNDRRKKLKEAEEDFQPYEVQISPTTMVELPKNIGEQQNFQLIGHDDPFDWRDVNNISLLFGTDKDAFFVKPLLTAESHEKFLNEEDTCKSLSSNQKLNHSQFSRTMLEIFKHLTNTNSKEFLNRFYDFGREFRMIRERWNLLKDLEEMQETMNKQCDYCGKVFECYSTTLDGQNISLHIKKCRLEKANCECGLHFSSPKEKRHHMMLKHSGVNYLECSQCLFLTQRQDALANHIEYFHGVPGIKETCDLCRKAFRSKYHLSIHQFTHETHYCDVCQREILGRLPFRNHMKNEHAKGTPCELCGKIVSTRVELEKHKKLNHADRIWACS